MKYAIVLATSILLTFPLSAVPQPFQNGPFTRLYGADNQSGSSTTNPLPTTGGGVLPTNITTVTAAIPAANTQVIFSATCTNFVLSNLSAGTTLYLSFVNPATTSSFSIPAGVAYTYQGPPINSIWIIGSAAVGNYSVLAR